MRSEKAIPVPHELFNGEVGGVVASTEQIRDYVFDKTQEELNRLNNDMFGEVNSQLSDIDRRVEDLHEINPDERLTTLEERTEAINEKVDNINSVVHAEFDDVPTKDSTKFVNSGAVYDAIHSSIINSVKITELDSLWASDLYKPNTPSRYTVVTPFANNNFKVGNLVIMADDEGHKLMQVLTTSLKFNEDDGTFDIDSYDNPIVSVYRFYNYAAHSTSLDAAGWSKWKYVNNEAFANVIRFDKQQSLSNNAKQIARENIGLYISSNLSTQDSVNAVPTVSALVDALSKSKYVSIPFGVLDGMITDEYRGESTPVVYSVVNSVFNPIKVGTLVMFDDVKNKRLIQVLVSTTTLSVDDSGKQVVTLNTTNEEPIITHLYRWYAYTDLTDDTQRVGQWSDWKYINHHISDGTVKWNESQVLMPADRERALANLGVKIDDDTSEADAVFLDPDSNGLPTSRYVNKAINALQNILNRNITSVQSDANRSINNLRTDLLERNSAIYDELSDRITAIYVNNGIRIFDGFVPTGSLPVINNSSVSEATNGEVLWYPTYKTFLYRVASGRNVSGTTLYTFYANWYNKSLYLDENNKPYDSVIYITGSKNYREDNGDLVLIEDSGSISRRIEALNGAITELQAYANELSAELETKNVDIKEVTHAELVDMIQLNSLEPGRKYRIIDYCSWFNKENLGMGAHLFDIIVEAASVFEINPQATAVPPKYRRDTYFADAGVNVSDFKIWYNPMAITADIEKYAPLMGYDGNTAHTIIIINATKEIFYCNSFEDNKLHYIGASRSVLSPYDFAGDSRMETYLGKYAEFMVDPYSVDFRPDKTGDVLKVYRVESLDDVNDPTKYVETIYKPRDITVLRPTGFIYRMIDNYNNDVNYDFKNLLFKARKFNDVVIPSGPSLVDEDYRDDVFSLYGFEDLTVFGDNKYGVTKAWTYTHNDNADTKFFYTFNIVSNLQMYDTSTKHTYFICSNNKIVNDSIYPVIFNKKAINNNIILSRNIFIDSVFINNIINESPNIYVKAGVVNTAYISGQRIILLDGVYSAYMADTGKIIKDRFAYPPYKVETYINSLT